MACPSCGRHSVVCGRCGMCLQQHCTCLDAECLKCGSETIVPHDFKFNGFAKHDNCGGQLVKKSSYAKGQAPKETDQP